MVQWVRLVGGAMTITFRFMISYKKLGFVNTDKMLTDALKRGYAVPAFNFNNMEQLQAIATATLIMQSPVILQVSKGAREYADQTMLTHMAVGALEMMRRLAREKKLKPVPIALHLDHGADFAIAKSCIETGFSSVMIDGSALSYEENIKVTKAVVKYAHKYGVTVEAELGVLAGREDDIVFEKSHYTDPKQAADFVARTGADSLAVSVGTSHGAYKFKPGQTPGIRLDIVKEIGKVLPKTPIVLHGASSVLPQYVDIINQYGGKMASTAGIPETDIRKAAKLSVCKVNIDSDGRLVMTAEIRRYLAENPAEFDPRKYLAPARLELQKMYADKIKNVLGSANMV